MSGPFSFEPREKLLSHIEVPLLVEQIERARGSCNISPDNQLFLADLKGRLLAKGNKTRIREAEIDRLDDIFCETGVYHSVALEGVG